MTPTDRSTIFALSSGAPPAAIAIIRISGPRALAAAHSLGSAALEPRQPRLVSLHHPTTGLLLDRALLLYFAAPHSATGEDVVELHVHGGRAVVRAVEDALTTCSGLRRAEPGEFTRRAVLNGRLDLAEAEALGDLLAAETEAQRRQAVRAPAFMTRFVAEVREKLLDIAARVEAWLDHDEIPSVEAETILALDGLLVQLASVLARPTAERLRDGFVVVIAGPPNAGKSSLFNTLLGREAAIVSPQAGTTRDFLEAQLAVAGLPIRLYDTAGWRPSTDDPVEAVGIERACRLYEEADLVLWLGRSLDAAPTSVAGEEDERIVRLDPKRARADPASALTLIVQRLERRLPPFDEALLRDRQRIHLGVVANEVTSAIAAADPVILAEHVRGALAAVGAVAGEVTTEDLLDRIFSSFCLGK